MTYKKQDRLFLLVTLVIEVPIGNLMVTEVFKIFQASKPLFQPDYMLCLKVATYTNGSVVNKLIVQF